MRIWAYTIVHNEALLMPWWLRHYQSFCEKVIVYDDQSDDGTQAIVRAAGAELRSLPYTGLDDARQAAFSSLIYREARGKADFVIVVDGDEFLVGNLDTTWRLPYVAGYQMIADQIPDRALPGQLYDYCDRGYPYPPECKPCVFRPDLDLVFGPGRHWSNLTFTDWTPHQVKLLHYRWFGREHSLARSTRNFARMTPNTRGWGVHVRPENRDAWADEIGSHPLVTVR